MEGQDIQEQQPLPAPEPRGLVVSYRTLAAAAGGFALAAVVGVLLWQFALKSSPAKSSSGIPGIDLRFPSDWSQVSPGTLKGAPPNAVVALLRKDKQAVLVVVRSGPVPLTQATANRLDRQLKAKYADFRPLRAQYVHVQAGKALLISYERTKQGRNGELDTVTIIPAGRISFVLNTTSPAGDAKIDHELQGIIGSAKLVQR